MVFGAYGSATRPGSSRIGARKPGIAAQRPRPPVCDPSRVKTPILAFRNSAGSHCFVAEK